MRDEGRGKAEGSLQDSKSHPSRIWCPLPHPHGLVWSPPSYSGWNCFFRELFMWATPGTLNSGVLITEQGDEPMPQKEVPGVGWDRSPPRAVTFLGLPIMVPFFGKQAWKGRLTLIIFSYPTSLCVQTTYPACGLAFFHNVCRSNQSGI